MHCTSFYKTAWISPQMHSGYKILITWKTGLLVYLIYRLFFRSVCYSRSVVVQSHLCTCLLFPAQGAEQLRTQRDGEGRDQCQDLWGEFSLGAILLRSFCAYSICTSCISFVGSFIHLGLYITITHCVLRYQHPFWSISWSHFFSFYLIITHGMVEHCSVMQPSTSSPSNITLGFAICRSMSVQVFESRGMTRLRKDDSLIFAPVCLGVVEHMNVIWNCTASLFNM